MLLNPASSGGHFEYVPALRSQDDECYDEVKKSEHPYNLSFIHNREMQDLFSKIGILRKS
jgi:hypothetical protein